MASAKYAYLNGKIVPWEEAKVHVYSPAVKYGAGVFEGIRGYWNEAQAEMYVFRLREHAQRLRYSQTVMRFARLVDPDEIAAKTLELLRANDFRETVHIRPMVYVDGEGNYGARGPVGVSITAVPRPLPERVKTGCTAQVSSWQRIPDRVMPARVKANANYNNSRLAEMQAREDGYDTALLLNAAGRVAEGTGMCFFMIRDGRPLTPTVTSDILESITRDTVLTLFREYLRLEPVEREIDRSELYAAEEAFFCGTGWEITPIVAIDRIPVGGGQVGPITRKLQEVYFGIVQGELADHAEWRTPVYGRAASKAAE
jgi:branched-chain amino acid aminotransferase